MTNNLSYYKYKDIISRFFIRHKMEYTVNSTKQFVFECPFCERDKFYFDPETTVCQCFRGCFTGNILTLIAELDNITTKQAYRMLGNKAIRVDVQGLKKKPLEIVSQHLEKEQEVFKIVKVNFPFDFKKFEPHSKSHIASFKRFYLYLLQRGITSEMVRVFKIYFSTFQERIVFPVYYQNTLVGWQGRRISDLNPTKKNPKSLTQPRDIFQKAHYLFNYDNVWEKTVITLVEGPIDACKCIRYNPIALFGKTISVYQLELIKSMPNLEKIYIGLDPEETVKIREAYSKLSPYYSCHILDIELGSDCGEKSVEELERYFQNAKKYDYLELKIEKTL